MPRPLSDEEITRQLSDLTDWSLVPDDAKSVRATFELTDFAAALDFVNRVGRLAEQLDHHPDIDIRWNTVTLTLSTHSAGGLTQLDVELAHQISRETT